MPEGVSLTVWQDQAKVLNDRLSLLLRNGLTGFILLFLVLALFVQLRLAFWVSLGIPLSFLGAIWFMPTLDLSISLMSLFAFVLVLGIVVDDAIVVGENIFTHQERHGQGLKGSIEGAQEIVVPVVFAVLTTVAAFLPLIFVPGMMGKFMRIIPLIVIPCLLFSLLESLLILPAHLAHMGWTEGGTRRGPWSRFQGMIAGGLRSFIEHAYRPVLERALRWRYLTLAIFLATLIITAGMAGGGLLRFEFFPSVEADFMSAAVTMPQGTPAETTSNVVRRLEASAAQVRREMEDRTGRDLFQHVYAAVGDQPMVAQAAGPFGFAGAESASHLGEVTIELAPAEDRDITSEELSNRWRELAGPIPEAVELKFNSSLLSPADDIDVQLTGPDLDELRGVAAALKGRLGEYTGVYEIADSFREGKQEVKLGITPEAEILGLTLADLGRQVRQAFYGEEAQRIQRARDDIRVMVRYPRDNRRSLGDLENMRIRTPDGGAVPFSHVALVELGRGYASIKRVDRYRAVNVTAAVDGAITSAGAVIADLERRILPEILAGHPGVHYSFEGMMAEQQDTMAGLQRGFLLAFLMVFALLAVPLKSYVQPLIIMSAIPFGMVGAFWGHWVLGMSVTMMSVFGMVALAGVVVNDSLVMVHFINRRRRRNGDLGIAIREAGVVRFRPILLTSLTTFAGLSPLLLEKSMQARFLIPMALSLASGVLFATFITLLLVPTLYLIVEDIKATLRMVVGARSGTKGAERSAVSRQRLARSKGGTVVEQPCRAASSERGVGDLLHNGLRQRQADLTRRIVDPALRQRQLTSTRASILIQPAERRSLVLGGQHREINAGDFRGLGSVREEHPSGVFDVLDLDVGREASQDPSFLLEHFRAHQADVLLHCSHPGIENERGRQRIHAWEAAPQLRCRHDHRIVHPVLPDELFHVLDRAFIHGHPDDLKVIGIPVLEPDEVRDLSRQGPHHVAQKLTIVALPCQSRDEIWRPSRSSIVISPTGTEVFTNCSVMSLPADSYSNDGAASSLSSSHTPRTDSPPRTPPRTRTATTKNLRIGIFRSPAHHQLEKRSPRGPSTVSRVSRSPFHVAGSGYPSLKQPKIILPTMTRRPAHSCRLSPNRAPKSRIPTPGSWS